MPSNPEKSDPWHDHNRRVAIARQDELWALRGKAIEAYANIEKETCWLFAALSGMDMDTAGIILYRIGANRQKHLILETLMKKKYGVVHKYRIKYFKGLLKILRKTDETRNEIVHWHTMLHVTIDEDGSESVTVNLHRPNFWDQANINSRITAMDISNFIEKCKFIVAAFRVLLSEIYVQDDPDTLNALREICQQALVYPPPEGSQIIPIFQRLRNQYPSSLP